MTMQKFGNIIILHGLLKNENIQNTKERVGHE